MRWSDSQVVCLAKPPLYAQNNLANIMKIICVFINTRGNETDYLYGRNKKILINSFIVRDKAEEHSGAMKPSEDLIATKISGITPIK